MNNILVFKSKGLELQLDGKSLSLVDKKSSITLKANSKIQISKKMKELDNDLIVIKNGENLEIFYSDGSSLSLEGFYSLENISLEFPIAENEINILSSNFESSSEVNILYTQGDISSFSSLFKNNSSFLEALNEYNYSTSSGLNAGDSSSSSDNSGSGFFDGFSTTTLVLGGVLLTGGIAALASGGGGSGGSSGGGSASVDTVNPTVTSIEFSDTLINEADVTLEKTVSITFSEAMNKNVAPTVATNAETTLTNAIGEWNEAGTVYTVTYTVADADVELADITFDVSGATDLAGNTQTSVTEQSAETPASVDTTAPLAPTALNLAAEDDLGASNTDNYTSQTTGLTIDGIGETGSLVQLYTWIDANTDTIIDDNELMTLGSSVNVTDGTFSTDIDLSHSLTDYKIVAKQTDSAGNVSAASTVLTVAVNTTVPTATLGTSVHFYESPSYIEITGGSDLLSLVDTNHDVENVDDSLIYTDFKNQFDFSKMTWTIGVDTITFESADIAKVEIREDSTLRIYLTASGDGKWAEIITNNSSTLLNADNTLDSLTITDDFLSTVYGVTDSNSDADMLTSNISSSFTTTPDGTAPTIYSDTIILDGAGSFSGVNIQGSVTVIQSQGLENGDEQTLVSIDAIDGSGYVENNNTTGLLTVDLSGSTIDLGGIINVGGGNLHVDLYSGNITNLYTEGDMLIAFDENANGSSVILDAGVQQLQVVSGSNTTVEFSGFTVSEDKINLWTGIFDAIDDGDSILNMSEFYSAEGATSSTDAAHRIIYNETDGSLYYDADGLGGNDAIMLMVLTDTPTLTEADFYVHTEVI